MKNKRNSYSFSQKANRTFLLAFALVWSLAFKGQVNYVDNGGFENLDSCTAQMQNPFYYPYLWIQMSQSWDTLKSGGGFGYTMHRCTNPNSYTGIPANLAGGGYQETRSGNGYAYLAYFKLTPDPSVNWRWYIQQKMKDTLKAGKSYCVTYWANLVNYSNYAVDELGAYFDDGSLQSISWCHEAPANPQVKSASGVFYMDSLKWEKVQGTFTASGIESYITIGNFRLNSATTYTSLDGNSYGRSLYFIDDISVIETDLPAYAGYDQYVIPGDSVYIGRPHEIGLDDDCFWYSLPGMMAIDTAAGLWVKPANTTTYVVKQDICGNIKYDTVVVYKSGVGLSPATGGSTGSPAGWEVFPNPASNQVTIKSALPSEPLRFLIQDLEGRVLYDERLITSNNLSNLGVDLVSGVYLITIQNTNHETVTKKLVINN